MQSQINSIVRKNSLRRGMPMRNVSGDVIRNSKVLDEYSFVFQDVHGVVHLLMESPISGEQTEVFFSQETFQALQTFEV